MFIANEKLETNIAEYIIYMFQIEDMLRAYEFDMHKINEYVIQPQVRNTSFEMDVKAWYEEIVKEMKSRGLEKQGHLFRIGEVLSELIYLHNTLKDVVKDKKYIGLLNSAEENIKDFQAKSDVKEAHVVQVCFQAIYMKFLLRLKQTEISAASEEAFDSMRIILAYLTQAYHQMKAGDMSMFEKDV